MLPSVEGREIIDDGLNVRYRFCRRCRSLSLPLSLILSLILVLILVGDHPILTRIGRRVVYHR